jgi:hypothetical protein
MRTIPVDPYAWPTNGNNRDFECVLLKNSCAATYHGDHLATFRMIKMQDGVFGSVSHSISSVENLP